MVEQRKYIRLSLTHPVHFLALGFGSGLAPKAPGTFGSIAAIPLILLALPNLELVPYIATCIVVSVMGIWICGTAARDLGEHDHASIVWDEVAGMLITFVGVAFSPINLLVGFALFRLFDIVKPWPISLLDKHVHGGTGIMLDDVVAGVFACAALHGLIFLGWLS